MPASHEFPNRTVSQDQPLIGAFNFPGVAIPGIIWQIVVVVPWDSYYGWLYNTDEYYNALMWLTAIAFLVAAAILGVSIRSMWMGQNEPSWVTPAIVLIYTGVWVAWACQTQKYTTQTIEDALAEQSSL